MSRFNPRRVNPRSLAVLFGINLLDKYGHNVKVPGPGKFKSRRHLLRWLLITLWLLVWPTKKAKKKQKPPRISKWLTRKMVRK